MKRLLFEGLFYLSIIDTLTSEKRLKTIIIFLTIGYSITSLDALWQYFSGHDLIRALPLYNEASYTNLNILRATATYHHPNALGVYLSSFFYLLAIPAFYFFDHWKGLVLKTLTLFSMIALILTFSRGAFLALSLTFIFIFFFKKNKIILILPIIGILFFSAIMPKDIYTWTKKSSSPITFLFDSNPGTQASSRLTLWKTAISMFKKHPYIGVGYYSFSDQYALYKDPGDPNHNIRAHNSYFSICAEMGLAGLLILLGFLIFIYRRGYQAYQLIPQPLLKNYHLAVMLSFSAVLINAFYESVLRQTSMSCFFWFLGGLICAVHQMVFKNPVSQETL